MDDEEFHIPKLEEIDLTIKKLLERENKMGLVFTEIKKQPENTGYMFIAAEEGTPVEYPVVISREKLFSLLSEAEKTEALVEQEITKNDTDN